MEYLGGGGRRKLEVALKLNRRLLGIKTGVQLIVGIDTFTYTVMFFQDSVILDNYVLSPRARPNPPHLNPDKVLNEPDIALSFGRQFLERVDMYGG